MVLIFYHHFKKFHFANLFSISQLIQCFKRLEENKDQKDHALAYVPAIKDIARQLCYDDGVLSMSKTVELAKKCSLKVVGTRLENGNIAVGLRYNDSVEVDIFSGLPHV